jgi:uncharacterized RDD family membrane protein YckC
VAAPGDLAERGARLLAYTLDELILLGISLPMLLGTIPTFAALLSGESDAESFDTGTIIHAMLGGPGTVITVIAFLIWCGITAWLVAANGQSIGKRLVGIKVVRTDGSPASFARIFLLRNFVNYVPLGIPYLGLIYQLVDPLLIYQDSRRCVHDLIADTTVVRCASTSKGPGST